ncbi:MAG: AbiH family protein [Streptococcus sp.]|nr:AbiH family protein [Streptococcus sp.]
MGAKNILILGNGFDLAMGRKTSYQDFLDFVKYEMSNEVSYFKEYHKIDIEEKEVYKKLDREMLFYRPKENQFLRFMYENQIALGENWCDIEHNIAKLVKGLVAIRDNKRINNISEKYIDKYWTNGDTEIDRFQNFEFLNQRFLSSLNDLTDLLELYLTYQDFIDFDNDTTRIKKQPTILDEVKNIKESKVLTFNYTNTANEILGIPDENTHFIHGRINSDRKLSPINTMVFGIEDENVDIDTDLMPYQKYYQRIVKETGNDYEEFFNNDGTHIKNIIIFGHSIDPLDKEIFLNCFELAKKGNDKYKFIVSYYSELDKRSIIKNLVIILGKNEVIDLT